MTIETMASPFEEVADGCWIANGECLELMESIPEGSVDLVLCDLPYGTTDYEWDCALDNEQLFASYRRVLTNTGTMLLFGSEPFSTKLRMAALDLYKYDFVWLKDTMTGFQHAKNMPMKNYELVSVFSKGSMGHAERLGDRRMHYEPQGLVRCGEQRSGRKSDGLISSRSMKKSVITQEYTNYPVMAQRWATERGEHPTQKPTNMLRYFIRTYCPRGGVVLDNTMGSGSTGVAAVSEDRSFIGIELNADFYKTSTRRIKEAASQLRLF